MQTGKIMKMIAALGRMLAVSAISLLFFASCVKEEAGNDGINEEYMTFLNASIEDGPATRASLEGDDAEGYDVTWDEGEQLIVFLSSGMSQRREIFELVKGAGTTEATFGCKSAVDWSSYRKIEAYCDYDPYAKWPSSQVYGKDGLMGLSPMKAEAVVAGAEPALHFKNVGGALRLQVSGCCRIANVSIEAEKLDAITLDCGEDGVQLRNERTHFWFAVPAGTYSGFKVTFTEKDGRTTVKSLKKDLVIGRSVVTTASISGIPEELLKMNVSPVRMDAVAVDCMNGIVKEGHPYSLKYQFHADDVLNLYDASAAGSVEGIGFVTDGESTSPDVPKLFYGIGAVKQKPYAVVHASVDNYTISGGDIRGLAVPTEQQIVPGMSEPSAYVWAGDVTLADDAQTCVLANKCTWVKTRLTENVSKVVFRSNDNRDVLSADGGLVLHRDGGVWNLAAGDDRSSCRSYVSAIGDHPAAGDVWMSVLPCMLESGFTIEFYVGAGDTEPYYAQRFNGKINMTAGMILDLGYVYRQTECSILARFNAASDGYYYQVKGRFESLPCRPDVNVLADFGYGPVAGSAYPFAGVKFDLYFYADLAGIENRPVVNGVDALRTGNALEVQGLTFNEYVVKDFVIPVSFMNEPYSLVLSDNGVVFGIIPLPHLGYHEVHGIEAPAYCIIADSGCTTYVRHGAGDYDYRLAADFSSFPEGAVWDVRRPDTSLVDWNVLLSYEAGGREYYLQHQYHRPVTYASKNVDGILNWGWWDLSGSFIKHRTLGELAGFYPVSTSMPASVLGAQKDEPGEGFKIYEIKEIR